MVYPYKEFLKKLSATKPLASDDKEREGLFEYTWEGWHLANRLKIV